MEEYGDIARQLASLAEEKHIDPQTILQAVQADSSFTVERIVDEVSLRTGIPISPEDPLIALTVANRIIMRELEMRSAANLKGLNVMLAKHSEHVDEQINAALEPISERLDGIKSEMASSGGKSQHGLYLKGLVWMGATQWLLVFALLIWFLARV